MFTLLGARPYTTGAILEELQSRGSEASYGKLLARAVSVRLGVTPTAFISGGNYEERVAPILRGLLRVGILESVKTTGTGRGRPLCFRVPEQHQDLLRAVLAAFKEGRGLPWVEGAYNATAGYAVARASRLNWERDYDRVCSELRRLSRRRAEGPPPSSPPARTAFVRGELHLQQAVAYQGQGRIRPALIELAAAVRELRRAVAVTGPSTGESHALATSLTRLGDLRGRLGALSSSERYLLEGASILASISEVRPDAWEVHRDRAVNQMVRAEIACLHGDAARSLPAVAEATRSLERAEQSAGPWIARRFQANLAMNRCRLAMVRAQSSALFGDLPRARADARTATSLAGLANRLSEGRNLAIWRRLGMAIRVRLQLELASDSPRHLRSLALRGDRAFVRAAALGPDEPDTLFERTRFLDVVAGLPTGVLTVAENEELQQAFRDARARALAASPDHPARKIDPSLFGPSRSAHRAARSNPPLARLTASC